MSEVETIFFGHWTQKAPIYSGYRVENVPLFGAKSLGVREGNHTTLPLVKLHDAEAEDCDEPSGAMHEV